MSLIAKISEITDTVNKFKTEVMDPKIKEWQGEVDKYLKIAQDAIDTAVNGKPAVDEEGNPILDENGNQKMLFYGSKKFVEDKVAIAQEKIDWVQEEAQKWVDDRMKDLKAWVDDRMKDLNNVINKKLANAAIEKAKAAMKKGMDVKDTVANAMNKDIDFPEDAVQKIADQLPDTIPSPPIPPIQLPKFSVDLQSMIPDIWSIVPQDLSKTLNLEQLYALVPDLPKGLTSKFNLPQLQELQQMLGMAGAGFDTSGLVGFFQTAQSEASSLLHGIESEDNSSTSSSTNNNSSSNVQVEVSDNYEVTVTAQRTSNSNPAPGSNAADLIGDPPPFPKIS